MSNILLVRKSSLHVSFFSGEGYVIIIACPSLRFSVYELWAILRKRTLYERIFMQFSG